MSTCSQRNCRKKQQKATGIPRYGSLCCFVKGPRGFPGGSDSKESTCNAGNLGLIPGLRQFPEGGNSNPLQYSCLQAPHGQWRLVCYSPWGPKELDTIKQLSSQHKDVNIWIPFKMAFCLTEEHQKPQNFLFPLNLQKRFLLGLISISLKYLVSTDEIFQQLES